MPIQFSLIVTNCRLVGQSSTELSDIGVQQGRVHCIVPGGSLKNAHADRIIDAKAAYVTPGGVDAHVHLDEPPLFGYGQTADDFVSGTRAAIAGGTTTIVAFAPQQKHEEDVLTTLCATQARALNHCFADYSFHMIIANPSSRTLAELPILKSQGITSIKIYMTYDALRLNDTQFLDVLLACREHKITTLVHAENDSVITWMTKKLEEKRLFDPKYHGLAHTPMAEIEATFRAICFSELLDTPILIVHVSNGRATESIRQAQANGLPIYAETCPQYLFLSHQHVDVPGFEGAKFICSPPLRDSSEHEKIWTGLEDGTFTILSSDHSPFKFNDACGKMSTVDDEHPNGHFKHIPNGFSGVETRLATVFSANRLSPERFVEVTSTNPAKLYGMYPKKGALEPGLSDADIVVWYPEPGLDIKITNHMLHHNVDYTPFEGHKVSQWPRYTILRGEVVWDRENGGVLAEPGYGSFVKRSESQLQGSRDLGAWNLETEF